MKTIAIIPARSGSKGLKDKNVKMLCGKPMMAYTISACLESGCFDTVHVSTDSEEYARIAREYNADVPFLRSEEAASDTASTEMVIREVLSRYEKMGKKFDAFAIMQPTSPLRSKEDIVNAFVMMKEKELDSVIGVCEAEHSPRIMNQLPDDGSMYQFLDHDSNSNRQLHGKYYRINGAMYLVKVDAYKSHDAMYGPKSAALIMPKDRSIDIDDQMDFVIAKAIMENTK